MKLSEYKAEDYISGAADVKALLDYAAQLEAENEALKSQLERRIDEQGWRIGTS